MLGTFQKQENWHILYFIRLGTWGKFFAAVQTIVSLDLLISLWITYLCEAETNILKTVETSLGCPDAHHSHQVTNNHCQSKRGMHFKKFKPKSKQNETWRTMHLEHDWSFSELLIRVALSWKGGKVVLHFEEVRSGIMILFSDSNGRCAKVLQNWHLVLRLCDRWVLQSGFPGEEFAVMARKEPTEVIHSRSLNTWYLHTSPLPSH